MTDVVICGGGMAGLCAALSAQESGASVVLIEKAPELGGNMAISRGVLWTFTDYGLAREHIPNGSAQLQKMVIDTVETALVWLAAQGVACGAEQKFFGHGRGWTFEPAQAVDVLSRHFIEKGGKILLQTGLESILGDSATLTGVRCMSGGKSVEIPARSVVLATGGFQANQELLARYLGFDPANVLLRAKPWSTGDGFLAAKAIGAAASPGLGEFFGHAQSLTKQTQATDELLKLSQVYGRAAVALNLNGDRFADESAGTSETVLNFQLARQPKGQGFYIIDGNAIGLSALKGVDSPTRSLVEATIKADGIVVVAQTIEELCTGLGEHGVPAARALQTLTEFNARIVAGRAGDLIPKCSAQRKALTAPPFYAVAVKAGITLTTGGVQTDDRTRVVRQSDSVGESDDRLSVIEGLFAAGGDIGNIHHSNYMGALAVALTTGRKAGVEAARWATAGS